MTNHDIIDIDKIILRELILTEFHPIVTTRDQEVIGVEALSRGVDPVTARIIPPNLLFDAAHRSGQVLALDCLCQRKALENFSRIFGGETRLMLWLNFEPSILDALHQKNSQLQEYVTALGMDPRRIVIEIIESKVSDIDALQAFIVKYREEGFLIAIDDWGTAYSNMSRIDEVKPDVIKVHRSFLCRIGCEYHKQEVIRSVLRLAHGIGSLVVVEGVETEETALTAMDLGASMMQGFFFCKPGRSWADMKNQCADRFKLLAASYRSRKLDMFNGRRTYFRRIDSIVEQVQNQCNSHEPEAYERILSSIVEVNPALECIYVLDENGRQMTQTVCAGRHCPGDSYLFNQPRRGSDRSLDDFFLLIQSGLTRYVSEPYISRSTGNRCVTISRAFKTESGRRLVLCVDCDCHRETLSITHPQRPVLASV